MASSSRFGPLILVMPETAIEHLTELAKATTDLMAADPRLVELCAGNGWTIEMLSRGAFVRSLIEEW